MTHQDQLANVKYRNWVRAGLGIKYVKEGLEPFCDNLATQQHIYILNKVQQTHNLSAVSCGQCDVRTLQPNHVRTKNKQCPLGQTHCNCLHPGGKTLCPSNVCGAIYDEIIQLHASTPPAPYWKNTDARQWCIEPWSVAKCFINAPGYEQKTKASEFDCLGLLHVLINNKGFQQHIKCQISGTDVFSRVRRYRNNIFHSHTMELEDSEVSSYICDMTELLEDEREIKHRQESKDVVKKLQELKGDDFVISTKDEAELHRVVMATIDEKEKELKQKIADAGNKIKSTTDEGKHDIEKKGLVIKYELEQAGQKITSDLVMKEDEIKTTATEVKHDIEGKVSIIKSEFEQTGQKITSDLVMKEDEIKTTATEVKHDIERKGLVIKSELEQTGQKITSDLVMKEDEMKTTATEVKHDIEGKGLVIKSEFEQIGQKITSDLEMKKDEMKTTAAEVKHDIEGKGLVIKSDLEQTGQKITSDLEMKEDEIKTTATEVKHDIEGKSLVIKSELEQTGQKIRKELVIREDESKKTIVQKGIEIEKQLTGKAVEAEEKLEQKLQLSKLRLESHKTMIEGSLTSTAEARRKTMTSRIKTDFQEKLVKLYETHVRKVPPLPRLHKNKKNVSDMYVSPWMTVEEKTEDSNTPEQFKISMHHIFRNKERAAKYIYVIGEAGSGKTTFCKILVHFWCIAHPFQECSLDELDIVKEMERFDFLFFVSLRHYPDCDTIENMIKKSYSDPALEDILRNDSGKCLIVLDGLDEWIPERKNISQFVIPGLPGRELNADYTIITTSRQWKFDALPISGSEVDKKIKLNGIDRYQIRVLTARTVETLNDIYKVSKHAENCITDLQSKNVSQMCHTPLILQQLVCLWFNGKLRDSSKCTIYRSMLDLFLEWKALGTLETQEPLYDVERERKRTKAIQHLSHLAHETLFDKHKEKTLTFSMLTLARLSIPDVVIKDSLNNGILKKELNVSLCESKQSSISFFHKSMQEYLAAVYIASKFREMLKSQKDEHDLIDICKMCIEKYFGSCPILGDILEQSNVFIMLCGLEPRLLTNVSEYIYNVTLVDKMVIEERKAFPEMFNIGHNNLIKFIQKCILECIEEVMSIVKHVHPPVYTTDLVVDRHSSSGLLRYVQNIVLRYVLSVEVHKCSCSNTMKAPGKKDDKEEFYLALQHLTNCDQLKALKVDTDLLGSDERIRIVVATILERNVRTLETISFLHIDLGMATFLVSILPKMQKLTSLQIKCLIFNFISNEVCLSIRSFLNHNTSLQRIVLVLKCKEDVRHMIDLSKNEQIQHVDFIWGSFDIASCNTDNLETCMLSISSADMMNRVCSNLYKASKLKHLELHYTQVNRYITDTENLNRLLPSLGSLSTLMLYSFTFYDNIITCPRDMKNLKKITLGMVAMSTTAWCRFLNSLLILPQVVTVETIDMRIHVRDGKTFKNSMRNKQTEDALQYVKEKPNLFRVTGHKSQFTIRPHQLDLSEKYEVAVENLYQSLFLEFEEIMRERGVKKYIYLGEDLD